LFSKNDEFFIVKTLFCKNIGQVTKNKFPKIKANDFLGEISFGNVYFFFLNTPNIFNKKYQLLAPAFYFWLNLTSWLKTNSK
jgi:hypothetical protein